MWVDQDDHGLRLEHQPMSGFLLQFALYEAIVNAPYHAHSTDLTAEEVEKATAELTLLPWEPWRWPNDSTRFFATHGMIAEVTYNDFAKRGDFSMVVGAAHRRVLRPLGTLGIPWSNFDG